MKKHSTLVVPVIFCLVCTSACKKDPPNVNTDEVRLTGLTQKLNGFSTLQISFVYDPGGKIRQISSRVDNANLTILYNVLYPANNTNQIIMAVPAVITTANELTDTIHLFLDANSRVTKRIRRAFEEYKQPSPPERTYTFDTTTYEYDAEGLLSKETRGSQDSTWSNPGILQTTNTRTTGQSTYTNSNGDLKSVTSLNNTTTTTRVPSNTFIVMRTTTGNFNLEYFGSYPNKTDFSNAAVLNELNLFGGLPMNKNYQHLPTSTRFLYTERDENGATINATSTFANHTFTHNYYGFLESKMDPARPETKVTFIYKTP